MSDTPILRCRFVILISGQGSNMQALVRACQSKACPGEVVAVISNRAQAGGLVWAQAQGVATEVVPHKDFATREAFDQALAAVIRQPDIASATLREAGEFPPAGRKLGLPVNHQRRFPLGHRGHPRLHHACLQRG